MNTDNNNNSFGFFQVVFIAAILGVIIAITAACARTNAPTTQSFEPAAESTSREYRYAKERVKLEGYSDREAAQAADAIMKFHNAQQARQR